jgi:chromosome segregation protein
MMYLKKLTLRGFKSFASTTSLVLEPGITCVVGPNGSGKSNVVDALAWVMGEQGAKSLRGGSMEDVIFAGTSSRAPLGRAEIQLTIDNTDGALPIDYTEVTISRTKFRNGNSEYAINGTPCRLLDVRELLSDSGIGREMHVVVGQGELDQILQATPETRRGFVEEAAGVLKHRERKEKALRKLEATSTNLNRVTDLISEIRRQLKPLGRQAEVAQRASVVQAEVRDAQARLLADDLTQAQEILKAELQDEHDIRTRRLDVETKLAEARLAEDASRLEVIDKDASYRRTQEIWFSLTAIGERVRSVISLAQERVLSAEAMPVISVNPARDPDTLLAQANSIMEGESRLRDDITARADELEKATEVRLLAEDELASAEQEFQVLARARSTTREDHARLVGELSSLKSRCDSHHQRLDELHGARQLAQVKSEEATKAYEQAQSELPHSDLSDITAQRDRALDAVEVARKKSESSRSTVQEILEKKAGLVARGEALLMALRSDHQGGSWLADQGENFGVLGSLASMIKVEPGFEKGVQAGLGAAGEAVVMSDYSASFQAIERLRTQDRGQAGMVVTSGPSVKVPPTIQGARSVMSVISGDPGVLRVLGGLLRDTVIADSLAQAEDIVAQHSDLRCVTRDGDLVSAHYVSGGASEPHSSIQITAALSETQDQVTKIEEELRRAELAHDEATVELTGAQEKLDQVATELQQADNAKSAAQETLGVLKQAMALEMASLESIDTQLTSTSQDLSAGELLVAELEERLSHAEVADTTQDPDSSLRDAQAERVKEARQAEMEARLTLTTLQERVRSLAGQAETLRKTAEAERDNRAEALRRRELIEKRAQVARSAVSAAEWLDAVINSSLEVATHQRSELGQARDVAEKGAEETRVLLRQLSEELQGIVDSAHHDELALTQQKMRIDALQERAMNEIGIDIDTLLTTYGPDQMIPVGEPDPETGLTETIPFVREEQAKRLRVAERDLQLLGRINPLALEEYDAMQTRHRFLSSQVEDLKKTRTDLLSIIDDVDARVQEVFSAAYTDVAREFQDTFSRLFPGGEGRLLLTEPDEWLTTGIDVEARPAGKKVKRLSLLSGGERALVAVCFLIALFKARPSPFYVLDEVEAALDDTNVGRLLGIYEELRATSQLVIITHQKRTMEIADTLYGVSMGSDGTSTVVSQRLRED